MHVHAVPRQRGLMVLPVAVDGIEHRRALGVCATGGDKLAVAGIEARQVKIVEMCIRDRLRWYDYPLVEPKQYAD